MTKRMGTYGWWLDALHRDNFTFTGICLGAKCHSIVQQALKLTPTIWPMGKDSSLYLTRNMMTGISLLSWHAQWSASCYRQHTDKFKECSKSSKYQYWTVTYTGVRAHCEQWLLQVYVPASWATWVHSWDLPVRRTWEWRPGLLPSEWRYPAHTHTHTHTHTHIHTHTHTHK